MPLIDDLCNLGVEVPTALTLQCTGVQSLPIQVRP